MTVVLYMPCDPQNEAGRPAGERRQSAAVKVGLSSRRISSLNQYARVKGKKKENKDYNEKRIEHPYFTRQKVQKIFKGQYTSPPSFR